MNYRIIILFGLVFSVSLQADTPKQAAIAAAHPLAVEVGEQILEAGGNAFDAAAAITSVLAVVEPYGSGLGGGGFWLLHQAKTGTQLMIDGRETAPSKARADMYLDQKGKIIPKLSTVGPLAAGIPGTLAGLDHIVKHYGRLSLEQILAPAILFANKGFRVSERYIKLAGFRQAALKKYPLAAKRLLDKGEIPALGSLIKQPELANTLTQLSKKGVDDFYRGEIAHTLVDNIQKASGNWQYEDLAGYQIKVRLPIVFDYRGMRIISAPPPSSGGITLAQMLYILNEFELDSLSDADRTHIIIEAMRRGYRDRLAYIGDPDYSKIPVRRLLDEVYLAGLALSIDVAHASDNLDLGGLQTPQKKGDNTTHFSIIDAEGNRVAATLTINYPFGSGYMDPKTGILLNNEMDDFFIVEGSTQQPRPHPNQIASGKRPLSNMSPTFIETNDRVIILGTPGGKRIISMMLLAILDIEKKTLPQSWVSLPRFHHQFTPDRVEFEQGGMTALMQTALKAKGHTLSEKNRQYGNMQAIMWWKPKNYLFAASDPRGEGQAKVILLNSTKNNLK